MDSEKQEVTEVIYPNHSYDQDTIQVKESGDGDEPERIQWTNKVEYFLSCLGCAVGLGNVWRFPYLCYRNGGGAFLFPYIIMVALIGIPMMFLHMSLGQFTSNGPTTCWEYAPLLKGFGIGRAIVAFYVAITYTVIIAWAIFYLFTSFTAYLPWTDCANAWNTVNCGMDLNDSSVYTVENASTGLVLPSEEFYSNKFLQISDGIHDLGPPVWYIVLCLIAAWVVIGLALIKGVRSIGKVEYFTALFPYLMLTILLIRGLLLPNAIEGIKFYIVPKWKRLADIKVWYDAAMQVFYSYALNTGEMITLASYNAFNNNTQRDGIRISVCNSCTSLFAGFVVFSYVGYMSSQLGVPIDEVANSGAGFAFIVYPSAVTNMPLSPLWSILFFAMLLSLGFGSDFVIIENVVTSIVDLWPERLRRFRLRILAGVCFSGILVGIMLCTQGGVYVLQLIDTYGTGWTTLLIAFCEMTGLAWIYGYSHFSKDVSCMIGYRPFIFWRITWTYVTPLLIVAMMVFSWVNFSLARYGDYVYPAWANGVGWVITLIPAVVSFAYIGYRLYKEKGSFIERIKSLSRPSKYWGPQRKEHRAIVARYYHDIVVDTTKA